MLKKIDEFMNDVATITLYRDDKMFSVAQEIKTAPGIFKCKNQSFETKAAAEQYFAQCVARVNVSKQIIGPACGFFQKQK